MLTYPDIDPVAISIGPFQIRWYGLAYLAGFLVAWWLARRRARRPGSTWGSVDVDDLIFFCVVGVILGGRLGWVLAYGTEQAIAEPITIIQIWKGGMSFHGALAGVLLAMWLFARRRGRHVGDVFDFVAPLPGLGLLFGRIANFINNELWGKVTDVPWAVIVGGEPRHPSQLYEALLEGLVLFTVLWIFTARPRPRLAPTGLFLLLYGVFRFLVEFVREPDENRGYLLFGWVTMGQILSSPMIIAGVVLVFMAYRRSVKSGNFE